jgi:hypothetical protein
MARGAVGSHTLIAWSYESNTDQGTYFSMVLTKDGAVIFRTQTNGANVTDGERNGSTGLRSDHRVPYSEAGKLADPRVTGYRLWLIFCR